MTELAALQNGLSVVEVRPQSLKKALGCAEGQKWRDRATQMFNKTAHTIIGRRVWMALFRLPTWWRVDHNFSTSRDVACRSDLKFALQNPNGMESLAPARSALASRLVGSLAPPAATVVAQPGKVLSRSGTLPRMKAISIAVAVLHHYNQRMSEPVIAQKSPFVQDVQPGTYWWCACGRSKSQPFCDGSHKGTDFAPMKVEITAAKKVAWCGCKHSQNKPFCDGSHSRL